MYKGQSRILQELETETVIRSKIQEIPSSLLQNSMLNFCDKLGYCQAAGGGQFEEFNLM